MLVLPYQQQLFFDDRAYRLRELRVPFNDLAADQRSSALRGWICIRGSELFHLPHDSELDDSNVRSQHGGIYLDGNACLSESDAVYFLPCKQQLLAEFNGLLWLPYS